MFCRTSGLFEGFAVRSRFVCSLKEFLGVNSKIALSESVAGGAEGILAEVSGSRRDDAGKRKVMASWKT